MTELILNSLLMSLICKLHLYMLKENHVTLVANAPGRMQRVLYNAVKESGATFSNIYAGIISLFIFV